MPTERLADQLRARMEAHHLGTHEELAEALGVSQSTATKWLNGSAPADEHAPKLARFLDVDLSEVLSLIYAARQAGRGPDPIRPGRPTREQQEQAAKVLLEKTMGALLKQGYAVESAPRSARVDFVFRDGSNVYAVEVKALTSSKNESNRMADALAMTLFAAEEIEAETGERAQPMVIVSRPPRSDRWRSAFDRAGVLLYDVDQVLEGSFMSGTTSAHLRDVDFAVAADQAGTGHDQQVGPRVNRPSPPEGLDE